VESSGTDGRPCSASLVTWTSILNSTEILSKEHETLSSELLNQVAEPLKDISTRYEDFRKRHEALAVKLQQERDGVYSDLKKTKEKYDAQCKEVEAARVKVEKSYDASKVGFSLPKVSQLGSQWMGRIKQKRQSNRNFSI